MVLAPAGAVVVLLGVFAAEPNRVPAAEGFEAVAPL
jgi:hypothetical protein